MLGKASEIKTVYVEGFSSAGGFHVGDCGIPANAIVIDIKFSASYEIGYGVRESALIIYKEE